MGAGTGGSRWTRSAFLITSIGGPLGAIGGERAVFRSSTVPGAASTRSN
jgi:hypothetical protein